MNYNVDFLVAALIILTVVFAHMSGGARLQDLCYWQYHVFLLCTIANLCLDLLCVYLITRKDPLLTGIMWFSLTVLCVIQVLGIYAFLCFTISLRQQDPEKNRARMLLWSIPVMAYLLVILTNADHGLLFWVEQDGSLAPGAWYLGQYGFLLLYLVGAAAGVLWHRQILERRQMLSALEVLGIGGVFLLIQAARPQLRLAGFGVSMGIMIQYLTVFNASRYTDNLTGTFDVSTFKPWYREQLRRRQPCFFLTVDIPQIKRIHYIYGRDFGDRLLVHVAGELEFLGGAENVFRIGDNRFLLNAFSLEEYERQRTLLMDFLNVSYIDGKNQLDYSAVVCGFPNGERMEDSDRLLNYVEYLVSLAPAADKTVWIQDNRQSMEGFLYQQEVERFLQTAIEQDLFELYYQPVYSVSGGRFVNLEALSRLHHPTLGMIYPEVFIGIAERTGQITEIGYQQFGRLCHFIKAHPELLKTLDNVKFNLSPVELLKQGYIESLLDLIREEGLPFSFFQFEITETVATEYNDLLYHAVQRFRQARIELCLDDFGSGYANLNSVIKLPFATVKLDRSLLEGICEKKKAASFYESLVSVMHRQGYQLVAEGVERKEELDLLTGWGVDLIQGYYFAKPMGEEALLECLGLLRADCSGAAGAAK